MEEPIMKTLTKLSGLLLLVFSACSTSQTTTAVHDDIYFSRAQAAKLAENALTASPDHVQAIAPSTNQQAPAPEAYNSNNEAQNSQSEYYSDPSGNTYITNQYFADAMYQDYYFSSRIRRFHRNWATFGYYDPLFSDIYWYNYDPFFYGSSIYIGYDPFWSFGWPSYYSWGYRPWGWAHYGYGWGYGSPWGSYWAGHQYGYWAGYHDRYWYGANPSQWYYPSTERYVYGARRPTESFTGFNTRAAGRYRDSGTKAGEGSPAGVPGISGAGGRYGTNPNSINTGERVRTAGTIDRNTRITDSGNEGRRIGDGNLTAETRDISGREQLAGRERENMGNVDQDNRTSQPSRSPERFEPRRNPEDFVRPERPQQGQQQTPRYARPNQEGAQPANANPNQERTRTYTSPSQQQPRSNQEYRRPADRPETTHQRQAPLRPEVNTPRPEQARPESTPQRQAPEQRPQATPQRQAPEQRPMAVPERSAPQQRPQAAPQRQPESRPQAAPQRQPESRPQAAPPRSSGESYSPPPRSSTPSSSSGNSDSGGGSSRSSGGNSSGNQGSGRIR